MLVQWLGVLHGRNFAFADSKGVFVLQVSVDTIPGSFTIRWIKIIARGGRICWVIILWALVYGVHAAHPVRDGCMLWVTRSLRLRLKSDCLRERSYEFQAARLASFGIFTNRSDTCRNAFARTSDAELAACNGDARAFIELLENRLSGARKSKETVGESDPDLVFIDNNECEHRLPRGSDVPLSQQVAIWCNSSKNMVSVSFEPDEATIKRLESDNPRTTRVCRSLPDALLHNMFDHIMGAGWCASINKYRVGGKVRVRPDESKVQAWREGQAKRAPYWRTK